MQQDNNIKNLVSIIIPVYNRSKTILETLNSVLKQDYKNWECIIVDDGSIDDSVQIIENFILNDKRFRLYSRLESGKIKGPSACRNIGIKKALGDYVIFLDSDDLLHENCLKNRIKVKNENKNHDVWVFKMQEFDGDNYGKIYNLYTMSFEINKSYLKLFLRHKIPFTVTCPLWKTSVIKKINGFDENFLRLEDPDLHCRALDENFSFFFDKNTDPDCYYRINDNSEKRYKNKEFMNNVFDSFYKFITKYSTTILSRITNNELKVELNLIILRVFKDYILVSSFDKKQFKKFYNLGKKKEILSSKDLLLLKLLSIYMLLGFNKYKGLGFYSFRKFAFEKINT
jgi:glycosyltransferase involved in cell wall biosynthesis